MFIESGMDMLRRLNELLVEYQQSRDCATTVQRARAKLWILLEFLPRDALA